MHGDTSSQRQFKEAVLPTFGAAANGLFQPQGAECGVGPGAHLLQRRVGAVRAYPVGWVAPLNPVQRLLGRFSVGLVLRHSAFQLRVLRLQIAATALKCRVLGLEQPDVLAKHRRTAMLVDELLKQFEWSHGLPVRKVFSADQVARYRRSEQLELSQKWLRPGHRWPLPDGDMDLCGAWVPSANPLGVHAADAAPSRVQPSPPVCNPMLQQSTGQGTPPAAPLRTD